MNLIGKFSAVTLGVAVLLSLAPTALAAAQFNTASGDRPTLQVVNATTSPYTNSAWSNSATVSDGNVLNFLVFYHNTGDSTATNTRLKINVPTSISNGSLSATGYVTSDNTSRVNGNASVTYNGSGSQSLTYINGSAKWYTGPNSVWTGIPSGQTGDEVINSSNGLNIGSVPVGGSGYVLIRVQVGTTNNNNTNASTSAPYAATAAYSNLSQSSVMLNGSVNPNGSSTTAWFEYGTSNSLGQVSPTFSVGNGNSQSSVSSSIFSLNANSTYSYRVVAQNAYGTSQGSIFSFSTGSTYVPPTGNSPLVTTNSATLISSNAATFFGSVNPNNSSTTTWFEYGSTTSLGNTTQAQAIGSGSSYISTTASALNLSANTTYYYRAVAQNSFGNAYGSILSIYTGNNNNVTVVSNNTDLSGVQNSLSQLSLALSGLIGKLGTNTNNNSTNTTVIRTVLANAGSLAKLTISADKTALNTNDKVVITVQVDPLGDIAKAILQVKLDPFLVFESTTASSFTKTDNTITYNLGSVPAGTTQIVRITAHLSNDFSSSTNNSKVTTTATLNYSDANGTAMTPLFSSLDVNVGNSGLFASIFGAFGWGSGLTILLIAALILLIAIAVRRLMV